MQLAYIAALGPAIYWVRSVYFSVDKVSFVLVFRHFLMFLMIMLWLMVLTGWGERYHVTDLFLYIRLHFDSIVFSSVHLKNMIALPSLCMHDS